jgi:hypothetical protein
MHSRYRNHVTWIALFLNEQLFPRRLMAHFLATIAKRDDGSHLILAEGTIVIRLFRLKE